MRKGDDAAFGNQIGQLCERDVNRLANGTPEVAGLMFDTLARDYDDLDPHSISAARSAVTVAAARGHVSLRQIKRIFDTLASDPPMLLH